MKHRPSNFQENYSINHRSIRNSIKNQGHHFKPTTPLCTTALFAQFATFFSSLVKFNRAPLMAASLVAFTSFLLAVAAISPLTAAGRISPVGVFPPTCTRIECPGYDVVDKGNGYEIRRYNSSEWMSTSSIEDISLYEATRTGFLQLFKYIQGKNEYKAKIEMTAPVITQVSPSDGPFCASSFVVSFYVPLKNQADPPPAQGLHVQKWGTKYIAIRQFGGFIRDTSIGEEAAALYSSLAGSRWASAVDKGQKADPASVYTVAAYNSPFEYTDRVNEIWMMLNLDEISIG